MGGTWYLNLSDNEESEPRHFVYPDAMFTVTAGMNVTNIVYEVLPATNCITGRVTDSTGANVPDLDVYAHGEIEGVSYSVSSVRTAPDRTYLLNVADASLFVGLECFRLEQMGYGCPVSKLVEVSGGKGAADFVLLAPAGPVTLSGAQLVGGRFRFQIDGTAGYDYVIERSSDLFGWIPLLQTNSATLPFEFVDPDPPTDPARFYRVRPMMP